MANTITSSLTSAAPTISSAGVGSGLDVNGIVTQLMSAEKKPGADRIASEKKTVATEVSAIGTLKGALSGFQSTLAPLKTLDSFAIRAATSSNEDIFTASASSGAATGSYDIEVDSLAQAQQISSTAFAASTTVIGTGKLTISLGSASFNVNIDSSNQSLAGIRDAINKATGNTGVRATLVSETLGVHLVLSSTNTGAANVISVATTSTDGLAQLSYNAPSDVSHFTVIKAAQDSSIKIAGYVHTSAKNVVNDAIDGVTLNLKSADVGKSYTLNVANDTDAAATRIKNFVSQYNAVVGQLNTLGKYDAASGAAGPLLGDSLLRNITAELRRGASDPVVGLGGSITALGNIGITTAKDGTLTLDENKLNAALVTNFDATAALFGSEKGVAARLSASIDQRLSATGDIATRNKNLDQRSKNITTEQTALDLRMSQIEARLRTQFQTLDTLLSKMQTTSSYLTQQFQSIANIGK